MSIFQDEEIEEVIESIKKTDSQKSVATSLVYSMDFTDSCSDKFNSSGMETYVLEFDSESSESPRNKIAVMKELPKPLERRKISEERKSLTAECSTSYNSFSLVSQEIYTQTSKTIIQLAESEGVVVKPVTRNTLQTQTSLISITENETIEYRISTSETNYCPSPDDCADICRNSECNKMYKLESLEEVDQSFPLSPKVSREIFSPSSSEKIINVTNEISKDLISCEENNDTESNSDVESVVDSTDMDEDSLMSPVRHRPNDNTSQECDTPKSVDKDVAELYNKLYETIDFQAHRSMDQEKKRFGQLTPLTEESTFRRESVEKIDVTPAVSDKEEKSESEDRDVLFTNNAGIKVKMLPREAETLRLPPIQVNTMSTSAPNLNFIFSLNPNKLQLKSGTLPCVFEDRHEVSDRWETGACGENPLLSVRTDVDKSIIQLPPIHVEGGVVSVKPKINSGPEARPVSSDALNAINIKDKIKELKMSQRSKSATKYGTPSQNSGSRSGSPNSTCDDTKATDAAEKGCDLLCMELLKRLKSPSWFEVADTLQDLPNALERFWQVMAEQRIADLLRQVIAHVESPRTQVARAACSTLADILKNTNYTKKPDFYEAITILLIKTGSFSRPVRRAANVALDNIVCAVDLSHIVTALCIHGATHKSALVRCASARLLVVCCALGAGGRDLLRARPASAACARKHALRSLATLLEDKNTETRKYAERLYSMLRPLAHFEAYYLTDVEVDMASRQMKKYDQLLLCGPAEASR